MTIKYKLSDVAKDFGVQNKQVVEMLGEKFGDVKKSTTVLSEKELDFVFNEYTKGGEVKNFDEYFATVKPLQKKPEEVVQEKVVQEEVVQEKAVQEKPEKAVQEKPEKVAQENKVQPAAKPAQKQLSTLRQQAQALKDAQDLKRAQAQKPAENGQVKAFEKKVAFVQKPAGSGQQASNSQNKPSAPRVQQKQAPQKRDGLGRVREIKDKPDAAPVQKREVVTRTVDTRTVDVNLDKFNEKYTNLAPSKALSNRKKQNNNNKQKLRSGRGKQNPYAKQRRETETEKLQRIQLEKARKAQLKVSIPDEITVGELASRLKVNAAQVVKKLMPLGVMASVSEVVDFDTACLVAEEFNAKIEHEVRVTIEERLFEVDEDKDENLETRPPVVVVMGHVDHGKTSILDAIRAAQVTTGEAGGITQHIGAYQVEKDGKIITFLDTPGHEAFTSMRARGANLTDIAVLVVAADDGIMPQTIESINHAKAAEVAVIVAINKMDKEAANPDKIMQQLTEHELVAEQWGGDVVVVQVSAATGQGIDELLEMINLTSEVRELKANPNRRAKGAVIEARLDKGQGPVATILVQKGTLNQGDVVIAGTSVGRVRTMRDSAGNELQTAGPSTPVEITGLTDVPAAGDIFDAVADERLARELADQRQISAREEQFGSFTKVTLDNLFTQIAAGEVKQLPVIVKADVQGSAEAVRQSLEKISNEEVRVKVIHAGVGAVNKSDIMLASAGGAIVIGFNVRPDPTAIADAAQAGVEMRMYRVIYDAINDVKDAMKGMLAPKIRVIEQGRVEVRMVYKVSSVGAIAGSYVLDGKVTRTSTIRVVRDGILIAEDAIASLRRFKDDVKEVAQGYECGITLEKFPDVKEGDIFEAYIEEEYRD